MGFLTCLVLILVFLTLLTLAFKAFLFVVAFILRLKFKDLEIKNEEIEK
jgi:hypothetical protein